jgi:cobalamin transport system substrate-binding protein
MKRHIAIRTPATMAISMAILCIFSLLRPAATSAFGIKSETVIQDQAGRLVDAKSGFKQIISLYGAHTENLFALGLDSEIIGVSPNEAFPPEALSKPVFSYHDDPEKFLVTRPDLVLIRPMIDRGYPKWVRRLEQSGIAVVSLQPGTVDDMYLYWRMLGILTGRVEQADSMTVGFKERVAEFNTLTTSIEAQKRVYFEAIHNRMKTFSPDAMAIFVLETAGGINVARDAQPVRNTNIAAYGKERILSHAREIDVYIAQAGAMNNPTLAMIREEPGFDVIKAVKEGQVFIINEMIVSRPTLRLVEGIQEIGGFLYPDLFKGGNH